MTEPSVDTDRPSPAPYVHPAGICESETVGCGTRVWAFAHVLPGAVIGEAAPRLRTGAWRVAGALKTVRLLSRFVERATLC